MPEIFEDEGLLPTAAPTDGTLRHRIEAAIETEIGWWRQRFGDALYTEIVTKLTNATFVYIGTGKAPDVKWAAFLPGSLRNIIDILWGSSTSIARTERQARHLELTPNEKKDLLPLLQVFSAMYESTFGRQAGGWASDDPRFQAFIDLLQAVQSGDTKRMLETATRTLGQYPQVVAYLGQMAKAAPRLMAGVQENWALLDAAIDEKTAQKPTAPSLDTISLRNAQRRLLATTLGRAPTEEEFVRLVIGSDDDLVDYPDIAHIASYFHNSGVAFSRTEFDAAIGMWLADPTIDILLRDHVAKLWESGDLWSSYRMASLVAFAQAEADRRIALLVPTEADLPPDMRIHGMLTPDDWLRTEVTRILPEVKGIAEAMEAVTVLLTPLDKLMVVVRAKVKGFDASLLKPRPDDTKETYLARIREFAAPFLADAGVTLDEVEAGLLQLYGKALERQELAADVDVLLGSPLQRVLVAAGLKPSDLAPRPGESWPAYQERMWDFATKMSPIARTSEGLLFTEITDIFWPVEAQRQERARAAAETEAEFAARKKAQEYAAVGAAQGLIATGRGIPQPDFTVDIAEAIDAALAGVPTDRRDFLRRRARLELPDVLMELWKAIPSEPEPTKLPAMPPGASIEGYWQLVGQLATGRAATTKRRFKDWLAAFDLSSLIPELRAKPAKPERGVPTRFM